MKQVLLFWFCIIYSTLGGQNSFIKFYEFNNIIFHFHDVAIVGNNYIVTGVGWDTLITPERQTFFNAKMDKFGNLLDFSYYNDGDSSEYGISTSGPVYIPCINAIDDTSFIVTYSNFSERMLELFLYNTELSLIKKCYVQNEGKNMNVFPKQLKYLNGCIYLAGTEYDFNKRTYESFLFKFTSDLDNIWKKRIPNIEKVRSFEYSVLRNEFSFSEFDQGDKYVNTDTFLNTKKAKKLADGLSDVYHENLKTTKDGKVLTSSYNLNGSPDFTLNIVKRDEDFNTVWKFGMGGIPGDRASVVNIIPSSNNAYFAYGQIGARVADIRDIYPSLDSFDIRILSTVKFREDGKILWQRFDTLEAHYYNASEAFSGGISACSDGGAVVTGDVRWFDTMRIDGVLRLKPRYKHFLMKIDSNGCVEGLHCNVEPKVETVLSVTPEISSSYGRLSIYPNPGNGRVTITRDEGVRYDRLTVYNAQGLPLLSEKIAPGREDIQLDLSGRPPGQYYITVRQDDGKILMGSLILVR